MIRSLIIFFVLLAGLILGPLLANQQGYVYIEVGQFEITTSFTVLVLLDIILFILLLSFIYLIRKVANAGSFTGRFFAKYSMNRATKKSDLAQMKILEGDYRQAEQLLSHSAKKSASPVLHYLQAAEASLQYGDTVRANELLEQAATVCTKKDQFAFDMVRTRLLIENKDAKLAKESVERLLEQKPRNSEVLKLAEKAYLLSGDYQQLINLIPAMYKAKVHSTTELDKLTETVYLRLIKKMSQLSSIELNYWWKHQPKKIMRNPVYQNEIIKNLIELGDNDTAQKMLVSSLKKRFDPQLIMLIPQIDSSYPEQLVKLTQQLEHASDQQPASNQALLNRTMALINIKDNKWDQAKDYINKAIESSPVADDYALLEKINEQITRHAPPALPNIEEIS